uniref:NADH:ubiquinone reductase (H(+)-translocating) n=1 Tax=Amphimerus sp. JM-2019 TaxID=2588351 RepID=A0A4Y5SEB1_9TREM|nr:NADH dehydrogenase subunit 5 [Amphimerus sp. JM-2019]
MIALLLVFCLLVSLLFWSGGYVGWCWSVSPLGFVFRGYFFDFLLDDLGVLCLSMLLFCGSVALFYCYHYLGASSDSFSLYFLMVWFLGVMCVLVLSGSVLFSLVFWEYLGLVSFFLILFYSNMSSLRASLVTVFASRFGDVSLFFLVMVVLGWLDVGGFLIGILLLLVVLSKSACYPFISWLLEAMRAPTPVSSLVHSSTLVAAGVWFFFRYSSVFADSVLCFILLMSFVTVFVSAGCALVFNDLKKLVALSTCNNVSWCLIFFICGDLDLALLQLLTHGVCKCYLFMVVGDLMSLSGGSQSSLGVYLSRYVGNLGVFLQSLLLVSLCGLPFLGVFFSKHVLFSEVVYVFGLGYFVLFVFGFLLSYAYSLRFVLLLLKGLGGLSVGYSSSFILVSFVSFLGTLVNSWGGGALEESSGLSLVSSLLLLVIQLSGCALGYFIFSNEGVFSPFFCSTLFMSDGVVKGLYGGYLGFSSSSILSFYRWEVYLAGLFPRVWEFGWSVFSFNILVLGLCLLMFLSLFSGGVV